MKPSAALTPSLVLALALGIAAPGRAEDHYVAPDGNDADPGTLDQPFATVERAEMAAAPGDTVFLRGGVYGFSGTQATIGVALTKSGQSGKPIQYFAYPGEQPILDLFELKPQARVTGIDIQSSWIHLRGLEVRGVRQLIVGDSWGVRIRGDHNVIEQLNVHDGEAPGIFIAGGASNLVLNCDSHHNYDPLEDGGNADGFGCHSSGEGNVLRGCRAYENSDDGFDFINAAGLCTVENSWAFRNGFVPDTNMPGANGAGFKAGGFGEPPNVPASGAPRHVVRSSVAFGNRAIGFYGNHHPGGIDFLNNTAFDNPANFDMRPPASNSATSHELRNNIAAAPGREIVNFNGGSDELNSWTLPVEVSDADFVGMDKAQALLPRRPDGSLPDVKFMHLAAGSDLIDRGEDVGLPFTGSAPDLGAFEWGATAPVDPMDAGSADAATGTGVDAAAPPGAAGSRGAPPATQPPVGPTQTPGAMLAGTGAPRASSAGSDAPPHMAAGAAAPANPGGDSSGCGCRVTPATSASPGWLLLLALPCLATRLRARRRSRRRR